jgi:hypothetical protein
MICDESDSSGALRASGWKPGVYGLFAGVR